jgi:acyl-CoA thioesterase-2
MADLWSDLLSCLDVRAEPHSAPPAFVGANQQLSYHRLFGGQLLAQFVRVAEALSPGKAVKSLHTLFPKAGRTDEPVRYEALRVQEGKTFATWSLSAHQSAGVIATASVSLHSPESGPEYQVSSPPVPKLLGPEHRTAVELLPWETRTATDLDAPHTRAPRMELWMRTPSVAPALGPALLAYATDLTLIGTGLLAVDGVSQRDAGKDLTTAVTSHTVWFHRPVRVDEWLLLRQEAPILAHGRSHGRGDVLTETGSLIASYAQDALLRFPQVSDKED